MDPNDPRKLVPTALQDPGYRSIHRGVRVVAVAGAALLLAFGLWAFLWSRPASSTAAPGAWLAHSPAPAVEVDSTEAPFPAATPFVAIAKPSALRHAIERQVPVLGLTPAPSGAVAAAQPADSQAVPRVLTSSEVAATSSRMQLDTPPTNAPTQGAATGSSFAGAGGDGHSAFVAHQTAAKSAMSRKTPRASFARRRRSKRGW